MIENSTHVTVKVNMDLKYMYRANPEGTNPNIYNYYIWADKIRYCTPFDVPQSLVDEFNAQH
jgi:hypothetical protein